MIGVQAILCYLITLKFNIRYLTSEMFIRRAGLVALTYEATPTWRNVHLNFYFAENCISKPNKALLFLQDYSLCVHSAHGVCVLRNTLVTPCACAKGYRVITVSVHSCVDLFVCLRLQNELSREAYDVYFPRKSQNNYIEVPDFDSIVIKNNLFMVVIYGILCLCFISAYDCVCNSSLLLGHVKNTVGFLPNTCVNTHKWLRPPDYLYL